MTSYMQPRSNLGGIARQPFRPGQWQGFKGATRNTTYIQNNFYGSSVFGANQNYGYYQPQQPCHQCSGGDSEMPKWMKWMVGIGAGTSILGGILKLFQKDKTEGGGETPPATTRTTTPTPTPTETTTTPPAGKTPAPVDTTPQTPTTTPTRTTTPTEGGDGDNNYACLQDGINMICRDASGRTSNIAGHVKVTPNADGSAPQSFSITDTSSGQAHEYTYELTGTSADGKPIYTCKSMNGQAASGDNAYTLEIIDGKPELVQYQNQSNYGSGLKFGSTATPKAPAAAPASTPTTLNEEVPELTPKAVVEEEVDTSEPEVAKETPKAKKSNPEEGRELGVSVATDLVGYTTEERKKYAINSINQINENNVVNFIKGYNENKLLGDKIIRQINTEFGWSAEEKLEAQKHIVEELYNKANANNIDLGDSINNYIQKFLETPNDAKLTNPVADNLDKIIDTILKKLEENEKTP